MSTLVSDLGHVVGDILGEIGKAVDAVVQTVEHIGREIVSVIGSVIHDITRFLAHHFVLLAVIAAAGLAAVAIFQPELIPVIWQSVEGFFTEVYSDIEVAVSYVETGINAVNAWIQASWAHYIAPGLKVLSDINTAAQAAIDIKQGHPGKALFALTRQFDTELYQQMHSVIGTVAEDIGNVQRQIMGIVNNVTDNVTAISSGLGQVQSDLSDIAQGFGITEAGKLAEGIGHFRNHVLTQITQTGQELDTKINNLANIVLTPWTQSLAIMASLTARNETELRLFQVNQHIGFLSNFAGANPQVARLDMKYPPLPRRKGHQ